MIMQPSRLVVTSMRVCYCAQPDLDCVWCAAREQLSIAEKLSGRLVSDIPPVDKHICNCSSVFIPAVDGAGQVGCDLA